MSTTEFSIATARDRFPGLKNEQVFFDNAGGSQVLDTVAESITHYLINTNVQLGASYNTSAKSTSLYGQAYQAGAKYVNARPSEIVFGASATQILRNLSLGFKFNAGDEIILSQIDHETNIDPWVDMAERQGLTVKWWKATDIRNPKLDPQDLKPLLSKRTRLVACTHTSNVLGSINDIKAIAKEVHTIPGALICVDGVAYAPHRGVNVQDLGVDFYIFSWYKVFGPHLSMLFGHRNSQQHIKSLGHYFNPSKTLEDKLDLAGSNYELLQAISAVIRYLGVDPKKAWSEIAVHEQRLQGILLSYLNSRDDITVYGETSDDLNLRVPIVSFTVNGRSSQALVEDIDKASNFGVRWGHFFSFRLVEQVLGLTEDGVVRVSMVHYNTESEVQGIVETLKAVLK